MSRLYVLEDSLGILEDFPLLGTGLGTFEQSYRRYQTSIPAPALRPRPQRLPGMATDTGAAGFLLAAGMAALFFLALMRGWRRKHGRFGTCIGAGGISSCLAMAVHSGTDFNLRIPANALLFAVIAALTHAAIFSPSGSGGTRPVPDGAPPRRPRRRAAPRASRRSRWPACCCISRPGRCSPTITSGRSRASSTTRTTAELDVKPIAADTMPSYLRGRRFPEESRRARAVAIGLPAGAVGSLRHAGGLGADDGVAERARCPRAPSPGKQALALAVAEAKRAIALEPTNPDLHLALGRLYAAAGREPRARRRADPPGARGLPGERPAPLRGRDALPSGREKGAAPWSRRGFWRDSTTAT